MEKRPFPGPAAWISSVVLLVYSSLALGVIAAALPLLLELLRVQPRLGVLGLFAAVLAPGVVITVAHHSAKGVLDKVDSKGRGPRGILPSAESVWAGLFGWCVVALAMVVSLFVALLISPPETEPDTLVSLVGSFADPRALASVRTIVWIVVAAYAYEIESRTRA